MMAFDAKTGGRVWSFDLVAGEREAAQYMAAGHGALSEGRRRIVDVLRARHGDRRGVHARREMRRRTSSQR